MTYNGGGKEELEEEEEEEETNETNENMETFHPVANHCASGRMEKERWKLIYDKKVTPPLSYTCETGLFFTLSHLES